MRSLFESQSQTAGTTSYRGKTWLCTTPPTVLHGQLCSMVYVPIHASMNVANAGAKPSLLTTVAPPNSSKSSLQMGHQSSLRSCWDADSIKRPAERVSHCCKVIQYRIGPALATTALRPSDSSEVSCFTNHYDRACSACGEVGTHARKAYNPVRGMAPHSRPVSSASNCRT